MKCRPAELPGRGSGQLCQTETTFFSLLSCLQVVPLAPGFLLWWAVMHAGMCFSNATVFFFFVISSSLRNSSPLRSVVSFPYGMSKSHPPLSLSFPFSVCMCVLHVYKNVCHVKLLILKILQVKNVLLCQGSIYKWYANIDRLYILNLNDVTLWARRTIVCESSSMIYPVKVFQFSSMQQFYMEPWNVLVLPLP